MNTYGAENCLEDVYRDSGLHILLGMAIDTGNIF